MSPRYALFCVELAEAVQVEAPSIAEAIQLAEEQTGRPVIHGQAIS